MTPEERWKAAKLLCRHSITFTYNASRDRFEYVHPLHGFTVRSMNIGESISVKVHNPNLIHPPGVEYLDDAVLYDPDDGMPEGIVIMLDGDHEVEERQGPAPEIAEVPTAPTRGTYTISSAPSSGIISAPRWTPTPASERHHRSYIDNPTPVYYPEDTNE